MTAPYLFKKCLKIPKRVLRSRKLKAITKSTKGQTMIHKTLHRNLKIEKNETH
jgi:hypothetical protein